MWILAVLAFVASATALQTPLQPRPHRVVADQGRSQEFDLFKYHSYAEIQTQVWRLRNENRGIVSVKTLGTTFENNRILSVKIGTPSDKPKPIVFIDAGIHAREWIAPASAMFAITHLIRDHNSTLLDNLDIVIVPSVNPDGYEYSRNKDRMWRKNRSGPYHGCYGVDLNRNFPFIWQPELNNPDHYCNEETYPGEAAGSELETKAIVKWLMQHRAITKAYLTIHSYAKKIVYPWGYAPNNLVEDAEELDRVGQAMAAAIKEVAGRTFTVMNAGNWYPAYGASDDFAKSIGIKYSYTMELNGDTNGFELPENEIEEASREAYAAILTLLDQVYVKFVLKPSKRLFVF